MRILIEVSDAELALFRQAMNPAADSGFGINQIQPFQTAQAEIVERIVAEADRLADVAHIGEVARECVEMAPRYEDGSPRKIQAIKLFRDRTGMSLPDAKAAVEAAVTMMRLERGGVWS